MDTRPFEPAGATETMVHVFGLTLFLFVAVFVGGTWIGPLS